MGSQGLAGSSCLERRRCRSGADGAADSAQCRLVVERAAPCVPRAWDGVLHLQRAGACSESGARSGSRVLIVDLDAHGGGTYSIVKRWPGAMDFNHRMVRTFETLEAAEAFVAEPTGPDVETVRRATHKRARMLDEYR